MVVSAVFCSDGSKRDPPAKNTITVPRIIKSSGFLGVFLKNALINLTTPKINQKNPTNTNKVAIYILQKNHFNSQLWQVEVVTS